MTSQILDKPAPLTPDVGREVAAVAAQHAGDVDAKARFPRESIEAAKKAGMLAAAVPRELGGGGATMRELAAMCTAVAQGCGSSGMVLAMHHIQVACVARHGLKSPFFARYLKEIVEKQILLASVTSEVGTGGDTRSSICAVDVNKDRFTLDKDATTVSYGEYADDLLVTCRRDKDASPGDQVLVLLRKGDFKLQRTGDWNTLGMRGTCSPSYKVTSSGPAAQILPGAFADSSAETMVPYSHILWAAVWLGIASDAFGRAAAFVRADARKKPGTVPLTATRLAEASVMLQSLRQLVSGVATEFDALGGRREELSSIGWALRLNNLKIAASEAAPGIVHKALQICGIVGYKNDSSFSVGRQYRDSLSAALMIGNDRITSKNASMLLVFKDE
jgi:acyl-CoA dehydrogenase